jgi:hypothetical protein
MELLRGSRTFKRWGLLEGSQVIRVYLWRGQWGPQPFPSCLCFLVPWGEELALRLYAALPLVQAIGLTNGGLKPLKLWAKINLLSFKVDHLSHFIIVMESSLTYYVWYLLPAQVQFARLFIMTLNQSNLIIISTSFGTLMLLFFPPWCWRLNSGLQAY